jgi:hypothetical protein
VPNAAWCRCRLHRRGTHALWCRFLNTHATSVVHSRMVEHHSCWLRRTHTLRLYGCCWLKVHT